MSAEDCPQREMPLKPVKNVPMTYTFEERERHLKEIKQLRAQLHEATTILEQVCTIARRYRRALDNIRRICG